jgi:hypothetical protein
MTRSSAAASKQNTVCRAALPVHRQRNTHRAEQRRQPQMRDAPTFELTAFTLN